MGDLVRLRTAHGAGSRESCTHDHIAVDASAREVECAACGALLDPFAVLDRFARDGSGSVAADRGGGSNRQGRPPRRLLHSRWLGRRLLMWLLPPCMRGITWSGLTLSGGTIIVRQFQHRYP